MCLQNLVKSNFSLSWPLRIVTYVTIDAYNNINSQLDATITNFIDNYNQLSVFQAIISPILRSTILCLELV